MNSTGNISALLSITSILDPQEYKFDAITFNALDIISIVIITGIFFIGIPGNIFVIYVFGWRRRTQKSRFELLLLVLGVIDFISLLLVPPSFFYLTITKYRAWHFGRVACKIVPSLLQISITVSQGMLMLICYERYCSIVNPFDNKRISVFRIFAWLCNVGFVSAVFIYPYAYSFEMVPIEQGFVCCAPLANRLEYLLASAGIQVFRDLISISTMAFLTHRMNTKLTCCKGNITWNRAKMTSKSRKVIKTVVIVFSILCLPVDIFHLIYYVMVRSGVQFSMKVFSIFIIPMNTVLNLLQISNSVVNVFIYSKMHVFFHKIVMEAQPSFKATYRRRTRTLLSEPREGEEIQMLRDIEPASRKTEVMLKVPKRARKFSTASMLVYLR